MPPLQDRRAERAVAREGRGGCDFVKAKQPTSPIASCNSRIEPHGQQQGRSRQGYPATRRDAGRQADLCNPRPDGGGGGGEGGRSWVRRPVDWSPNRRTSGVRGQVTRQIWGRLWGHLWR